MKISLNVGRPQNDASGLPQGRFAEQDVLAWKDGDWEAKARVLAAFAPLLSSLARQRGKDNAAINEYLEAGKHGLHTAVRKYTKTGSPDKFQIFALGFIEKSMDQQNRKGFFARLFGR